MPYSTGSSGMMLSFNYSDFYENYSMFDLRYCNWQKDLFHGVVPNQQYGDVASVSMSVPVVAGSSAALTDSRINSSNSVTSLRFPTDPVIPDATPL